MTINIENDDDNAPSTKPWKDSELKFFAIVSIIYIIVAAIFFYFVISHFCGKHTNRILDAFYFSVVLMTSSGYTDLAPKSNVAITFAIIFACLGIFVFGALMSVGADQLDIAGQKKPFEVLELAKNHQKVQYSGKIIKYSKVLAVWLAVHMVGGIYFLACNGKMHFLNAVYCASSTITTVISDEKCFSTKGRRIIALFLIFDGMIVVGAFICVVTELWTQRAKFLSVQKNLKRKPTLKKLQKDDFDDDGFIRLKGYTHYRLMEIKSLRKEGKDPKIKQSGRKTNGTYRNFMEYSIDGHQASPKPSVKDSIQKLANSDDIWDTMIVCVVYLGSSIIIFYVIRDHLRGTKTNRLLDAVYFSSLMMTSVGYGDLHPDDTLSKIFASIFSLSGLCVIGKVLSMKLDALDEKHIDKFRKLLFKMEYDISDQRVATRKESIVKRLPIKLGVLVGLMVVWTPFVHLIEKSDFIHALYCTSITITSSGTETCFSTKGGRGFALLCMFIGAAYKGWVFFLFTEVYIEEKEKAQQQERTILLKRRQRRKEKHKDDPPLPPPPPPKPAPPKPVAPPKPAAPPPPPQYGTPPEDSYYPPTYPYPQPMFGEPDSSYPPPWPKPWVLELDEVKPYYDDDDDDDDDGDPIIPESPRVEEMVMQEDDDKDIEAIEKEFKILDVSRTGRLTLHEVMNS